MRPFAAWALAGGATTALAGPLAAQQPPQTVAVPASTFQMPGTPVGTPLLQPVGTPIPKAAPAAGTPVGTGPGGIPTPLDPRAPAPPGQVIDLTNVIAPYPGMPKPPPSFWEQLQQRWFALFQSDQPAQKPTQWTPGIGRRNREREKARQQEWWRRS
jgi:hypothetical protein